MTSRERDDALLGAVEDHYEGDNTGELVEDPANLPAVDQPPRSGRAQTINNNTCSAAGLSDCMGRKFTRFENLLWPDLNL